MTEDARPIRRRVAVVTGCELSPAVQTNGFFPRYVELIRQLGRDHDLLVIYLRPDRPQYEPDWDWLSDFSDFVEIPTRTLRSSRTDRVVRSTRKLIGHEPRPAWEAPLLDQLTAWMTDVVVAVGHPLDQDIHAATASLPTVSFVEEDHTPLPEHQRSWQGTVLRWYEDAARRRWTAPPAVAVVISDHEVGWGRRKYPRSEVLVVPHRIDTAEWEEPVEPSTEVGEQDVLIVGAMDAGRNADGLHDIARALLDRHDRPDGLRLSVISHLEPSPVLAALPKDLIRHMGRVDDLRPSYRAAGMALVPAFAVTGSKTTILQAWATGCPVVTTTQAARATGATPGVDVLCGETPTQVADDIIRLASNPDLRDHLRRGGRARLDQAHSARATAVAANHAMEVAMARRPERASLRADLGCLIGRAMHG
jgi:glycosyltransferase involved in cell wall biosynthesis